MQYRLSRSEESQSIICIVVVVAVFFLIILPQIEKMRKSEEDKVRENFKNNNILNDFHKVDTNICSANCCGIQYPVSFDVKKDERLVDGKKYVASNYTCTGHHGTGCICLSKEQRDYLAERGDNA